MSCARALSLLLCLSTWLWASPASGSTRLVRSFGADAGLTTTSVLSLERDDAGYLWIATYAGVLRFDGQRFERWAPDLIRGEVSVVRAVDGVVYTGGRDGVFEIAGADARPLVGPPGQDLTEVYGIQTNAAGLWLRFVDSVWLRRPDGSWTNPVAEALEGDSPIRLVPLAQPGESRMLLAGRRRVLQLEGEAVTGSLPIAEVRDAVLRNGGITFITGPGEVLHLSDGELVTLHRQHGGVGQDLEIRGDALWAAFDIALVRLEDGLPPEVIDADDGLVAGGTLLLDHEASLWMGTFLGLAQLPEPDTVAHGVGDGLPSSHTRFLGRDGSTLMVSTWQDGVGTIRAEADGWKVESSHTFTIKSRFCSDQDGQLWSITQRGVVAMRGGTIHEWPLAPHFVIGDCSTAADGSVWLATRSGLLHSSDLEVEAAARIWRGPKKQDGSLAVVDTAFEQRGRLFASFGETLCSTEHPGPHSGGPPAGLDWRCEALPGIGNISAVAQLASGSLWVATALDGVYALREGTWRQLPASRKLPAPRIDGLVTSPAGGAWILGHGSLIRVEETEDGEDWVEAERLSSWNGVPSSGGTDLIEEPDGSLWITSALGVVHVPATARASKPVLPVLAELEVTGVSKQEERPDESESMTFMVNAAPNDVQIEFSTLSYRDPARLQYRVRRREQGRWSPLGANAKLRLVDLPPGTHEFIFAASTDGVHWASSPPLRLVVARSFWAWPLPWLLLGAAGLLVGLGWVFGRSAVPASVLTAHDPDKRG